LNLKKTTSSSPTGLSSTIPAIILFLLPTVIPGIVALLIPNKFSSSILEYPLKQTFGQIKLNLPIDVSWPIEHLLLIKV
jgi:hypothetical protein